MQSISPAFEYVFPAIRGVQARREFFVSMVPLRMVSKVFSFNEDGDSPPDLRHQRALNKARLPAMVRYIVGNRDSYTFSAITASIDAEVRFEGYGEVAQAGLKMGVLHVPMGAKFVINDGQHRRAAIAQALEECPDLGDESIAVVFFMDTGLSRCQQMFSDLNGHAVRTSRAINILFDHRQHAGEIAKHIAFEAAAFRGLVEMDRSTLAARSKKLVTLSAIYAACKDLLQDQKTLSVEAKKDLALRFWETVADQFPAWRQVVSGDLSSSEVRQEVIYLHGIGLHAIGRAGRSLIKSHPKDWETILKKLRNIDWTKKNVGVWEGRSMIGGKLSKSDTNVTLTSNVIKKALGLNLSPDEQRIENNLTAGGHS